MLKPKGEDDGRGLDGWIASLVNGHESKQTQGDSKEQGDLIRCSSSACKESDTT